MRFESSPASARMVNRTHRAVRARAMQMNAQRDKVRSLWLPLGVGAALLLTACIATTVMLAQYDVADDGVVDSGEQIFMLLVWFVPVSFVAAAAIWYKRRLAEDGAGY